MKTEKDAALDLLVLFLRTDSDIPTTDFITAVNLNISLYGRGGYFSKIESVINTYLEDCSKSGFRDALIQDFGIDREKINFYKKDAIV